jgi:hypothetical protein
MREMAAAISTDPVSTGVSGSAILSKRFGRVVMVKRAGSRRAVTSLHVSGHDAGAPGSGRKENGATIVWP